MKRDTDTGMVDFSAELAAIKAAYGRNYHREPQAFSEAVSLWDAACNEHGVLVNVGECIEVKDGRFKAEIRLYRTGKGFWLIGMSLSTPVSGFASPASIWDPRGFTDRKRCSGVTCRGRP